MCDLQHRYRNERVKSAPTPLVMVDYLKAKMPKSCNSCHCCPYGFHIDRGFVEYCESLYNIAQLDKLKQKKRERRKEQITVESCLGISVSKPSTINGNDEIIAAHTCQRSTEESCLSDLDDVMSDFEDTWQKSLKKKTINHTIHDPNQFSNKSPQLSHKTVKSFAIVSRNSTVFEPPRKSVNHVINDKQQKEFPSRVDVECWNSNGFRNLKKRGFQEETVVDVKNNISQDMAITMEKLSQASLSQGTVGIQRDVLSNIREQMATSLKRMKELEEQVKSIPLLQVKLSAVNEEKTVLLKQLQTQNFSPSVVFSENAIEHHMPRLHHEEFLQSKLTTKNFRAEGMTSTENLASPALASNLNDTALKRCFVDSEIISQLSLDEDNSLISVVGAKPIPDKDVKNVGTSCSILTRDVGVGHIQSKSKSTGVGDASVSSILLCFRCSQDKELKQSISMSSESLESDSDSTYDNQTVFSHQKQIGRFPKIYFKSISTSPINTSDSLFWNCRNTVDASTYTRQEVREVSTLTDLHMLDICFTKLENEKKMKINKGMQCDFISKSSKGTQISPQKCFSNKTSQKCVQTSNKKIISVGCGMQSIHDVYCTRCELRQTETIGIGDGNIHEQNCLQCTKKKDSLKISEVEETPVMLRSIGINTCADSGGAIKSDMHICDKCNATIQSIAQDFTARKAESIKPLVNTKLKLNIPVLEGGKSTIQYVSKTNVSKVTVTTKQVPTEKQSSMAVESSESTSLYAASCSESEEAETTAVNESMKYDTTILKKNGSTEAPINPYVTHHQERIQLSKEVKAACKVLSDHLQKPDQGSEKKMLTSMNIIKKEWFQIANQKHADAHIIERYLDALEEISRPLLQRVVNFSDNNGNTAIHYAVSYSNFDVVSILVDSKVCDVNKKNKAGYTCIMLVALADMKNDVHNYVIQRLFHMGDINIKAKQNGQTALMLAVSRGKLEIVKMLIEAGSEINLQDNDGSTALMCAGEHGHIEIIRVLLSHPDCDPTILDSDGCNALAIAMEAGHKDIGLLLYANTNFSKGSSPYSSLKKKRRSNSRSTPPPRTPTLRTPPSPSARSTSSLPSAFHFLS